MNELQIDSDRLVTDENESLDSVSFLDFPEGEDSFATTLVDDAETSSFPGARSATVDGEVFLGGNFIELGLSSLGDFGTTDSAPDGFFGTNARSNIGMSVDRDGFGVGEDLRADIFLPGTPEESWVVGYIDGSGNTQTGSNSAVNRRSNITPNSVVDTSSGNDLSATSIGTFNGSLEIEQDISFEVDDKFFRNTVTLTNVSGETLDSVRYMRTFDPDNTVDLEGGSGFSTINTIRGTIEEDGFAAVIAENIEDETPPLGDSPIFLYSNDPRARASYFGFTNTNPFDSRAYDSPPPNGSSVTNDIAINMTFDVGSLDPGESTTFTYFTSLDERSFDDVVDDLNEDPTAEDDSVTTDEATALAAIDVLGNDSDPDGDTISIDSFDDSGTLGLVSDNGDGTFSYDPNGAFDDLEEGEIATDSFTYTISDGNGGIDTATVTINIDGLSDPSSNPVFNPLNPVDSGTGGNDGIVGTDAADLIEGLGGNDAIEGKAGDDQIDGGDGTDTAVYQFDPAGVTVDLGSGTATDGYGDTDTLISIENIIASDSDDDLTGDGGNNNLTGRDGDDVLEGDGGNDFLLGGAGIDFLDGGAGNDTFLYQFPDEGSDTIANFEVGSDKITIVGAIFPGDLSGGVPSESSFFSGSAAVDDNDRFGYDASTGDVLFDEDGAGGADALVLASLTNTPAFTNADILVI